MKSESENPINEALINKIKLKIVFKLIAIFYMNIYFWKQLLFSANCWKTCFVMNLFGFFAKNYQSQKTGFVSYNFQSSKIELTQNLKKQK